MVTQDHSGNEFEDAEGNIPEIYWSQLSTEKLDLALLAAFVNLLKKTQSFKKSSFERASKLDFLSKNMEEGNMTITEEYKECFNKCWKESKEFDTRMQRCEETLKNDILAVLDSISSRRASTSN